MGRRAESGPSAAKFWIVFVSCVVGGILILRVAPATVAKYWWAQALAISAVIVIVALRQVIWLYLKGIFTGQRPRIAVSDSHGRVRMRCPRCSAPITVEPVRKGGVAFNCPACGETCTWVDESNSSD